MGEGEGVLLGIISAQGPYARPRVACTKKGFVFSCLFLVQLTTSPASRWPRLGISEGDSVEVHAAPSDLNPAQPACLGCRGSVSACAAPFAALMDQACLWRRAGSPQRVIDKPRRPAGRSTRDGRHGSALAPGAALRLGPSECLGEDSHHLRQTDPENDHDRQEEDDRKHDGREAVKAFQPRRAKPRQLWRFGHEDQRGWKAGDRRSTRSPSRHGAQGKADGLGSRCSDRIDHAARWLTIRCRHRR